MAVKIQILFDVDLPTGIEQILSDAFPPHQNAVEIQKMSGRALSRQVPGLIAFMVRHGYMPFDVLITTTPGNNNNEKVEESVEQPSPL
jgi:hypothetical protein